MKRYALIGHNISYSLSSVIHRAVYDVCGIDATYEIISVEESELDAFVEYAKRNLDGFNITKPYKEKILPYLTDCTLKSVNTVVVKDGKLYGYSTDAYGFMRDIKLNFGSVSGKALVLGAGGAGRVIASALKQSGMDVYLNNRTEETGLRVAEEIGVKFVTKGDVTPDFVVNCTSYGFNAGENPALDGSGKMQINDGKVKWVYDTIYSPPETEFLKSFPSAKKANGYGMLIFQAVEADRIMCERKISEQQEKQIYELAMARITKGER